MSYLKSLMLRRQWLAVAATLAVPLGAFIALPAIAAAKAPKNEPEAPYFRRVATFYAYHNSPGGIADEAVAEIVAASEDGMTLIYTDSAGDLVGFVDITDPSNPVALGSVPVGGEPTSVAVIGQYALACVNTSADFVNTSGHVDIIDLASMTIVRTIDLGGQPDSIAASPDRRYAAIAIENERDEDLGDGAPPQAPAGFVVIIDTKGSVASWKTRKVDLVGIADRFPEDPEPEYIDINKGNIAAVTLQENNHVVLINLANGKVVGDFSTGEADLSGIDTDDNSLIVQNETLNGVPREPDAIAWISESRVATADEGDLDGGSRGFTFFSRNGKIRFTSGSNDDQLMAMVGHYPEGRSDNKGNEAEGIKFAEYGADRLLFVGSERSSVVSVYRLDNKADDEPRLVQVLPVGAGPEGFAAIPSRNLFAAASEEDDVGGVYRVSVTIYARDAEAPTYPKIVSGNRPDGSPIPWAALSALAADPTDAAQAWTVYDSAFDKSRIFPLDVSKTPALIAGEIVLIDSNGALAAAIAEANDAGFASVAASDLINGDGTVNLDPEGLARRSEGGFWVASEGSGNRSGAASLNWLLAVSDSGIIEEVVSLPDTVNAVQRTNGFEGVASIGSGDDEVVYVCFQRQWYAAPTGSAFEAHTRIGRYLPSTGEWTFYYYELEDTDGVNGDWIGLSEIVAVSETELLLVERDKRAGPYALLKSIYGISIDGLTPLPDAAEPAFPLISKGDKVLLRDLIPDLRADNGSVIEKVEGLAVLANGQALIVTDNDGVDESSGETQLIHLGTLAE